MNMPLPETRQQVMLDIHEADLGTIHQAANIARCSVDDFCSVAVYLLAKQTVIERQFPPVGGNQPAANDQWKTPVLARG